MSLLLRQRFSVASCYKRKWPIFPSNISTLYYSNGSKQEADPSPVLNGAKEAAPNDSSKEQQKQEIKVTRENWSFAFAAVGSLSAIAFIIYGLNDYRKSQAEQLKYSDERKYNVIKEAMLKPIPGKELGDLELYAKDQTAMVRDLVFSNKPSLVLIEGAAGSGKTTLVKKLLNERINKDKVPCYYWSLKQPNLSNLYTKFMERFGISEAISSGKLSKDSANGDTLLNAFRRLKKETGKPCVFVLDDAQQLFECDQGGSVALFLQECYCEDLMTVIFIGSEGSCLEDFRKLSGYRSRLLYRSLPPVPDQDIKTYLLVPLNKHLKASGNCLLFSEEMADWFVSRFGGNFADLELFITEVLENKKMDKEVFLSRYVASYQSKFKTLLKNHEVKVILDDLVKLGSFDLINPYDIDALTNLIQENIVAQHADKYTWNKRVIHIAYILFPENRQTEEELEKAEERQKQKKL